MHVKIFALMVFVSGALSGCGDLLKEKKKSDPSECKIGDPACDCVRSSSPVGKDPGGKVGIPDVPTADDVAEAASPNGGVSEADSPFNHDASLALMNAAFPLDRVAPPPGSEPSSKNPMNPVQPVRPPEVNPCVYVPPPPPPPPPGCYDYATSAPKNSGAGYMEDREMPYNPARPIGNRCAADATQSKNAKADGRSEAIGVNWKVLPGLKNFAEAKAACAALGPTWSMPSGELLSKLYAEAGFLSPVELNCGTAAWAADPGANTQCVAGWRGFSYVGKNGAEPLPINQVFNPTYPSGQSNVTDVNSVICVEGKAKPTISCKASIDQIFRSNPTGVVDAGTGLTWARITVKTFKDTTEVEAQCAMGAAQGWRIPTKAETEAALRSDLFNTAAYGGNDASCPLAWYKSDDPAQKKTCVSFGTAADGAPIWKIDDQCRSDISYAPTTGADSFEADPSGGAAAPVPQPPVYNYNVLGICVKDKK